MAVTADTIRGSPFFKGLPEPTLEAFSRVCVPRTFGRREIIYLRGETDGRIFLVLKGEVELYMAHGGARIVIRVFREGDFFGDLSFVGHPAPFLQEEYAQAAQETEVCVLSSADMTRLLEGNALFAMALLVNLRNRLHHAESKIRDLAISEAPTRILNELIRYTAAPGGGNGPNLLQVRRRLTHQQIADFTGLARETATKALGMLEEQGFISYTPARAILLNAGKIAKECVGCVGLAPMRGDVRESGYA